MPSIEQLNRKQHKLKSHRSLILCANFNMIRFAIWPAGIETQLQSVKDASVMTSAEPLRDGFRATVPAGLQNCGATCYVNSLLQYCFWNLDVREIVLSQQLPELSKMRELQVGFGNSVACTLNGVPR